MKTKYDVGDRVTVSGTIVRTEILPENRILYYMDEVPGVPIQEQDVRKEDVCASVPAQYMGRNNIDDELAEANNNTRQARQWLIKKYGLNATLIIEPDKIKVLSDELYLPIELSDVTES